MEIIKVNNLTFSYPMQEVPALNNISFSVDAGEFVTICGKSGCGKSTLLRQLKPVLLPNGTKSGEILFENKNISELSHKEQASKIGFVLQSPDNQIVTDKVWHELAFGLESLSVKNQEIRARVSEMAAFFGIESWYHSKTSELSGGQKQLLNLASVMVMNPLVLILDEPTSQLDPIAAQEFLRILSKINRELGTTVILSEHRLEEALPISDRVLVMENAEIIADGTPEEVGQILCDKNNDMLCALPAPMRVYFSAPDEKKCPITVRDGNLWLKSKEINKNISFYTPKILSSEDSVTIKDVCFKYEKNSEEVIKGLSLNIKKGELYTIVGGNGAGKTTALYLINSLLTPYRGQISTKGKIAMLPQNPQTLFTRKTVAEDLAETGYNSDIISVCELDNLLDKHPYDLSGGEQQRAALAKVLQTMPDILLLDEPTKGLDVHFKEKLAGILNKLTKSGITIIMVTHDIEFAAKYSDRTGMFFDGKIVSEGISREFFAGKSFYTTAANRMARNIIPEAVLVEDIVLSLGGKLLKNKEEPKIKNIKAPERVQKEKVSFAPKNIVQGLIFALLFILVQLFFFDKFEDYRSYIVQAVSIMLAGLSIISLTHQKPLLKEAAKKQKLTKRTALSAIIVLVLIPITILGGVYLLDDRKYYFISLMIIFEIILSFIISFENRKAGARELVMISVLCAITVAGRSAFYMLPQFKPVTALVIISAAALGGEAGFLIGAVSAFVSNFFFGQGPWTPWQMFAFGLIGFCSGLLFNRGYIKKNRISLSIFGALSTLVIYGGIMNPSSVLMWDRNPSAQIILSSFVMGFPLDIIHALSTVFFLWFISEPMLEKLERIKIKYGV